jgi:osmoprotectant transport system substrate-binding protein
VSPGDVLMVEDAEVHVAFTRLAFEREGIVNDLRIVRDGEAAMALLDADPDRPPRLILLDLGLPRMSGFDVLEAVRNHVNPRVRRTPVVVLTTSRAPGDVRRAYELCAQLVRQQAADLDDFVRAHRGAQHWWLRRAALPSQRDRRGCRARRRSQCPRCWPAAGTPRRGRRPRSQRERHRAHGVERPASRSPSGRRTSPSRRCSASSTPRACAPRGFEVATSLNLGDEQIARARSSAGSSTATRSTPAPVLVSLCERAPRDLPQDPRDAFARRAHCLREDGPVALPPTPFQSTNEVGVRRETAERLRLRTISDLRRVDQRLTLFGSPECPRRRDCLRGLREVYGLDFARFQAVPIAERHRVLARGERVASIVFSTDPQIPRQDIVVLRDDRRMLPPANSTFVISPSLERRAGPAVRRVVAQVQKGLTETAMRELNARVDLDGRTPAQAAKGYLRDTGLVP